MRRSPFLVVTCLVLPSTLCACPAPRNVSGVVYDGARATFVTTGRAFAKPLVGASVTWSCGATRGPTPQSLTTDQAGRFASKDFYDDMPATCVLTVTKPGYEAFHETFEQLCEDAPKTACRQVRAAIELRSSSVGSAIALTAPSPSPATVIYVVIEANSAVHVDGVRMADDAALTFAARASVAKDPNARAVIKADVSAPFKTVMHTLDTLKVAGVTKISFGVAPSDPTPLGTVSSIDAGP